MKSSSPDKPRYYREVDSLRAIAVIAVVLNHIDSSLLSGGFLGVDIFFVISGFVVSASLVKHPSNEPLLTFLKSFYQRRIKRLYPALLVCTSFFTLLSLMIFADPAVYIKTAFSAVFGLSNMYLAHQASDYFAVAAEVSPFTHTWSLGVEEQFYLLFPLIYYFFRRHLAKALTLLLMASFALFFFIKTKDSTWAFYLMPTRLWQFALGALVFASGYTKIFRRLNPHLALIPLALMAATLAEAGSFRISSTFLISIASALILCFIKETPERRYLSLRPILLIGLYSYSIYLFHWPVLVFFKQTISLEGARTFVALGLIVAFSLLSYKKVESPLRRMAWGRGQLATLATCLLAVVLAVTQTDRVSSALFAGASKEEYALSAEAPEYKFLADCYESSGGKKYPRSAREMEILLFETCQIVKAEGLSRRSIYLFGSSHSKEKLSAFVNLAKEENWNLFFYGKAAVSIGTLKIRHRRIGEEVSRDLTRFFFEVIEGEVKRGDMVVLSVPLYHYYAENKFLSEGNEKLAGSEGFKDFKNFARRKTEDLADKGVKLRVVAGYPVLKKSFVPVNCYQPWSKLNPDCTFQTAIDTDGTERIRALDQELAADPHLHYISLFEPIAGYIEVSEDWARVYHDRNHLSVFANTTVVYPEVRQKLVLLEHQAIGQKKGVEASKL